MSRAKTSTDPRRERRIVFHGEVGAVLVSKQPFEFGLRAVLES